MSKSKGDGLSLVVNVTFRFKIRVRCTGRIELLLELKFGVNVTVSARCFVVMVRCG